MITRPILEYLNGKFHSIIIYLVIIGLIFFLLAAAILFYPDLLFYVFIVSFFAISFVAFLIAIKINHIKKTLYDVMLFIPKKKKKK
ncbi:hypothetical protein JW977_03855 [Candidatus Falkowbacteria bacterium]|nr:hypothetical protein [Candidatus Falkowbacteria bacterium]